MKTNLISKPKLYCFPSYTIDVQGTYKSGMTMYLPSITCPGHTFTYIGPHSYFDKYNAKEEAALEIEYYEKTGSWDLSSWDIN